LDGVARERARMDASDLKRGIAQSRRPPGYPIELREAASAYVATRRTEGMTQEQACAEIVVSPATVSNWRARASRPGKITRVAILPETKTVREVVVDKCGHLRVRGLDVAGVAELLRRLG
jgi:transcriptional regulator with XRE-family HTH domain